MTKTLSYADSGVSIDAGDELVERIKPFAKKTLIPGVLGSIGGSALYLKSPKITKNRFWLPEQTAWAPN